MVANRLRVALIAVTAVRIAIRRSIVPARITPGDEHVTATPHRKRSGAAALGLSDPPTGASAPQAPADRELETLRALEKKVLWLATWTIHHANQIRVKRDHIKVGGHQ